MAFLKKKKQQQEQTAASEEKQRIVVDETGLMDIPYLVLTILLMLIGLIMLFSASYAKAYEFTGNPASYFVSQGGYALIGLLVMFAAARFFYQNLQRLAFPIMAVAIVLLVLVLIIGTSAGGAQRWIKIGISFQPSEIAKFAVILFFATYAANNYKRMRTFRYGIVPYIIVLGIVGFLLWLEPHKSAIAIIFSVSFIMMILGGSHPRYLWIMVALAVVAVGIYAGAELYKAKNTAEGDYASDRLVGWLNSNEHSEDESYQIVQSRYAIGPGGLTGVGFGKSNQKTYLPEEHNDYIFAIVCEELGLIGAGGILLLFMLLIIRGYWISMHARDRFGMLLGAGLTTLLAIQVFFNVAVVTNLFPPTGISLPFFSSGGTALILQMGESGIVLSISRWTKEKRA